VVALWTHTFHVRLAVGCFCSQLLILYEAIADHIDGYLHARKCSLVAIFAMPATVLHKSRGLALHFSSAVYKKTCKGAHYDGLCQQHMQVQQEHLACVVHIGNSVTTYTLSECKLTVVHADF